MKSYDSYLRGLYGAIFTDLRHRYPHLQQGFRRDYSRLLSLMEARGLPFLTVDLVDMGKHFDKCISSRRLTASGLPGSRAISSRSPVPCLFKGLVLRVFHLSGELRDDFDVNAIQALRQLYNLAKKLRLECTNERKAKALRSFFEVETSVRRGSQCWDYDDPRWGDPDTLSFRESQAPRLGPQRDLFLDEEEVSTLDGPLSLLDEVSDIISSSIGRLNPMDWSTKHGPGAVSDQRSGESKYSFPHWPDKLASVFPIDQFAFANWSSWVDTVTSHEVVGRFSTHEPPSKIIMVPKTARAPRLIASEPVAHQWCQQLLKEFLAERSSSTWISKFISFRDQTPNQKMALSASHTGDLATIDLSEASDRLSTFVVERLFKRNETLLNALHATRTRWCVNTIDPLLPKFHKLRKFACMGSACTFPVQSLFFLSLALTACLYSTGTRRATIKEICRFSGSVRVFGDDIIVPVYAVELLKELLAVTGLKVNQQKTFWTGKFRESCGVDAFDGHDVSAGYVMTVPTGSKPESVISSVAVSNNFLQKGYPFTADYIKSTVRQVYANIPDVGPTSGAFGFHSPLGFDPYRHKARRNQDTWANQVYVTVPHGIVTKTRDLGHSMLLQYFIEEPEPTIPWKAGYAGSPIVRLVDRWVDRDLLEATPRM